MKSTFYFFSLSAAGLLAVSTAVASGASHCEKRDKEGTCTLYSASIVQLIANPDAFHAKKVRVIGYMKLEFEGNALYLHAEDYKHSLNRNGLWLEISNGESEKFGECKSKSYVLLEGKFNAENTGHFGLWSGGLENITRCTPWR